MSQKRIWPPFCKGENFMGFKITYLSTNVFTTFQFTKVRLFNSRKVEFDTYTHLDKTTYGD